MIPVLTKHLMGKWFNNTNYLINFLYSIFSEFINYLKGEKLNYFVLKRQILFTGVDAAGLVILNAIVISGIIIIQLNTLFYNVGNSSIVFMALVSAITRELASFLPAVIIIARSGTAITTELGNMVINKEIDALYSMGIPPEKYLVLPRILAVVFSMIPLAIFFNFFSFLSSAVFFQFFFDLSPLDFIDKLAAELTFLDIFVSLLKSIVFGFLIASISCFHGLRVEYASTEVPQRTSRAVVHILGLIILADVFITTVFYIF